MKVSYCDVHWPIFPILVTVKHSGLDIELECEQEQVDQDNEATKVNPVHTLKKPKFIAEDLILYGYESIVFYIAPEDLLGSDICEKSLIQQWLSFIDQEIIPLLYAWVYPILGLLPYHAQSTEKAKKSFQQVLSTLDSHLCNHTFLVGERLTLADVLTACALLWPYVLVFDPSFREPYIGVNRWFNTCINFPVFKEALGEVPLCTEAYSFKGKPCKDRCTICETTSMTSDRH